MASSQDCLDAVYAMLNRALAPAPPPPPPAEPPQKTSQEIIDEFWRNNLGSVQPPNKPFSVLPDNIYAKLKRQNVPKGPTNGVSVDASYYEAVKDCEAKVAAIVRECKRNNIKYSDPHFNLDDQWQCLEPLSVGRKPSPNNDEDGDGSDDDDNASVASSVIISSTVEPRPDCAKRVGAIFEKPQFFIGGPPNVKDTRQGAEGDCWFISSIGSLCVDEENRNLVEKLCPPKARNEKVGVYGFVFYRDGEWISEIIDDKLYLACPDYDDCDDSRRDVWDQAQSKISPSAKREGFRKTFQTGSNALFYGSCSDQNETWVPLMEKAFAKAHGDYHAISGGMPGEGIEDLTGGITTSILSADILDVDELWEEGLMKVNKEFLFGAATKHWTSQESYGEKGRQGIQDGHAYSVLKAVEYKGNRLLLVKNPWGHSEWSGPWSDGSEEWTSEALRDLEYTFGDDGIFWMPFEDFLRRFDEIWRTRLFSSEWNVTQRWTTIQVPWAGDYNPTKFQFYLPEPTRAVVVLSKLDDRYFKALAGRYVFNIAFRLHVTGEEVHLVRGYGSGDRSAVAELDLDAGEYDVLIHISAIRNKFRPKIEDIVSVNWLRRREKLIQIGLSYDLAHAKGQQEPDFEAANSEQRSDDGEDAKADGVPPAYQPQTSKSPGSGQKLPFRGKTYAEELDDGFNATEGDGDADPDPQPEPAPNPPASEGPTRQQEEDGDGGDFPGPGAWNATLVVGLRVFCQSTSAEIRIVNPATEAAIQSAKEQVKLDIDDPEKDSAEQNENYSGSENEIDDSS